MQEKENQAKKCAECGKLIENSPSKDFSICMDCFQETLDILNQYKKVKKLKPSISQILNNLYLGNEDAALSKEILVKNEITHILIAGSFMDVNFPDSFVYHQIPVQDSINQNIKEYFAECYNYIEQSCETKGKVFVHCSAGVSRSATIVISYLMKKLKLSFDKAYEQVKKCRQEICPNSSFIEQLKEYETELQLSK